MSTELATKPAECSPQANDNMALWDRLFRTDPSHTKAFNRAGGFKGTAIRPYWCIMRATQEFGPVGIGWGWNELEHRTYTHTDGRAVWFSKVVIWYRRGDQKYETGPQWGATELVAKRTSGDFVDEEAAKKAVTDGLTKCLSYLGLAGDVHMGLFDDSKYVEEQKAREARESQGVKVAPETVALWRDTTVASAKACKTSDALKQLWEGERATWKQYAGGKDQATKAVASYVKSQVERRAVELKQDAVADQAGMGQDDQPPGVPSEQDTHPAAAAE